MRLSPIVAAIVLIGAVPAGAEAAGQTALESPGLKGKATLTVTSSALKAGAPIPDDYTAYGKNVSPPLSWSKGPSGTRSFALVLEDPDAPMASPFVHWVMWNIPAGETSFTAGKPPAGAVQGKMTMGRQGYFGPRPPPGSAHHYHFEVFALDRPLELKSDADPKALEAAMAGHVLASGELVATYQKP